MTLFKYTPGLTEPETLKKTLLGRTEELKTIDRILKNASRGKSISHPIIIGPRGIGKTHFLRIIYNAVKGSIKIDEIKSYEKYFVPVIFAEEVYLDTLEQLIEQIIEHLKDENIEVPEGLSGVSLMAEREREIAISYLKTFRKKTGKMLLVIIDNIDEIMGSLTEEDQAALRDILMTSGSVLLIGAAPTLFSAIENHDKPFYNFFETVWLGELSYEESYRLLESYAEINGRKDLLETFKISEPKIRAIYELAGGTPRLMLCFYEIIAEGDVTKIEDTFLSMLDELTPYFRDRVRDLAKQQREIIDVMARAEKRLTPTEIAERCRMPVNVVNSQLSRLERINYVFKTSKKGTRRVYYDLKEKLFGMWRQMRVEAGKRRLGFLVKFYEKWYSKEELVSQLDKILKILGEKHCEHADIDKLWYIKEAIPKFSGDDVICVACKRKEYKAAMEIVHKKLGSNPNDAKLLSRQGCIYLRLKCYGEAVKSIERAIDIEPRDYEAWNDLGKAYAGLKKFTEAVSSYKEALALNPDGHGAWCNIGDSYNKLLKFSEAIDAFKKAIEIKPDYYRAWYGLGHAYEGNEKFAEAIDTFKKATAIKPKEHPAWHGLSVIYKKLHRYEDAINAYQKAVETKSNCYNAWLDLGALYLIQVGNELLTGNGKNLTEYLRSFLKCLPHIKDNKIELLFEGYSMLLSDLLKKKRRTDEIKVILEEIEKAGQKDLLEFLSPYVTLIKYLDTKDDEILERLRSEERAIVEEMLKALSGMPSPA